MNVETVLKCAEMAATKQRAFLGVVDQDILDLIAELTPAPVVESAPAATEVVEPEVVEEAPVTKSKKSKAAAE